MSIADCCWLVASIQNIGRSLMPCRTVIRALALYFLPHGSKKDLLERSRPRVVKWYCPFADQAKFPSGHRYCINVYAGCEHQCAYCYAAGYVAGEAHCKNSFRGDLAKDLDGLDAYDVPPAPVHLSNSTDALQPLEMEYRHCLFALEKLAERRHRFTTVTLLTKNPAMLLDERYVDVLHRLNTLVSDHPRSAWFKEHGHPPLRIEVSLAFWNDERRRLLDAAAPSVESRIEAIRFLRKEHLPVHLRIARCSRGTCCPAARRWKISACRTFNPWRTWNRWCGSAARWGYERSFTL